jgi:hypothetical protein
MAIDMVIQSDPMNNVASVLETFKVGERNFSIAIIAIALLLFLGLVVFRWWYNMYYGWLATNPPRSFPSARLTRWRISTPLPIQIRVLPVTSRCFGQRSKPVIQERYRGSIRRFPWLCFRAYWLHAAGKRNRYPLSGDSSPYKAGLKRCSRLLHRPNQPTLLRR